MERDLMRAGDSDRQAVAEQLRAALDEGRLDLHEYDERLRRAYGAKTYGELRELLMDLPTARPPLVNPVASADHLTRRWLLHLWSGYLPTVAICLVIWLVASTGTGDLQYFWPIWVAGPWGLLLIWQTVSGLTAGEPQKWQAKLDKAERKKQLKKERKALERDESSD